MDTAVDESHPTTETSGVPDLADGRLHDVVTRNDSVLDRAMNRIMAEDDQLSATSKFASFIS
jgi:hypothetical protein